LLLETVEYSVVVVVEAVFSLGIGGGGGGGVWWRRRIFAGKGKKGRADGDNWRAEVLTKLKTGKKEVIGRKEGRQVVFGWPILGMRREGGRGEREREREREKGGPCKTFRLELAFVDEGVGGYKLVGGKKDGMKKGGKCEGQEFTKEGSSQY
jgi:hypothetical protein